ALLIDESYNANPASMRATLAQLGTTPASRRVAVLGSMKELGDFAPSFHAQLAAPLGEAQVDYAILVGEEMLALARELGKAQPNMLGKSVAYAHCEGPGDAIAALEEFGLAGGDAVLVQGSTSVGLGRVVAHFAAREGSTPANVLPARPVARVRRPVQSRSIPDVSCRCDAPDGARHWSGHRSEVHQHAARAARQGSADPRRWPANASRQSRHSDDGRTDDPDVADGCHAAVDEPGHAAGLGLPRGHRRLRRDRLPRRFRQSHEA